MQGLLWPNITFLAKFKISAAPSWIHIFRHILVAYEDYIYVIFAVHREGHTRVIGPEQQFW